MKDEIEARLQVLVGQPLIVSYRVADTEVFSFGELGSHLVIYGEGPEYLP